MEEHCTSYGLPARTDNVIVATAISQVSQIASLEVTKITRRTVPNFLNFIQPVFRNSVINCQAL